jgi:hypothetical protein
MQAKLKEFRSAGKEPVRVISDDFYHSAIITADWQPIREELWKDAYSKGCVSKDMAVLGLSEEQTLAVLKAKEIRFEDRVKEVMIQILEEGDPESLDASGRPKINVIGDIIGKVPSAQLRNALYKEIIKD